MSGHVPWILRVMPYSRLGFALYLSALLGVFIAYVFALFYVCSFLRQPFDVVAFFGVLVMSLAFAVAFAPEDF